MSNDSTIERPPHNGLTRRLEAPPTVEGAIFARAPRPAVCSAAPNDWQRRYGAHALDYETHARAHHHAVASVDLMRSAGEDVVRVRARLSGLDGLSAEVTMKMMPHELCELACRLIDAAADIEAHPAASLREVAT